MQSTEKIEKFNSLSCEVIYIYTIDGIKEFQGYCKIGQTSISIDSPNIDDISQEIINSSAIQRISQINNTAGLNWKLEHASLALKRDNNGNFMKFSDHDFHRALQNNGVNKKLPFRNKDCQLNENVFRANGREWFEISSNEAVHFLLEYKNGEKNFTIFSNDKVILREHQNRASEAISIAWKKVKNKEPSSSNNVSSKYLLNAIMRFGKCLTAYDFIFRNDIKKTIILTHRPVVDKSWEDDFKKFFKNKNDNDRYSKNYNYYKKGTLDNKNILFDEDKHIIYFCSLQDMRGIEYQKDIHGNYVYDESDSKIPSLDSDGSFVFKENNKEIFESNWDLVIIDEAHEGNFTELAKEVHKNIKRKFSLFLSGTPFNIICNDDFDKEFQNNIFSYNEIQEKEDKENWTKNNGTDYNPFGEIPDLKLFGIYISREGVNNASLNTGFNNNYFDFNIFFQLDESDKFVNENEINNWLNNICANEINNYNMPYNGFNRIHTIHSLWILPIDVKKANALQQMLENHYFFKKYKIFNVCGDNYKRDTFDTILDYTNDENTLSITLTIGRLTQGVSIPGWTTILMLNNISSPIGYFQSIYRVKTSSPKTWKFQKNTGLIFDFNPDRMLDLVDQAVKKVTNNNENEYIRVLKEIVNYYNVMIFKDNNFVLINDKTIKESINKIRVNRIINNGFKSFELIDRNKIDDNIINNLDIDELKEFVQNLEARVSSNKKINFNDKITDNSLDEKIYSTNEKEQEALSREEVDKLVSIKKDLKKELLKIRTTITTILSRVPFMLIGKYKHIRDKYFDNFKDLTPDIFCNFYNDEDWKEIMQNLRKKDFKDVINKFINIDLFNLACESYIYKIGSIINIKNPLERREMWIDLFKNIHNPDSETVLTPWYVVDIQYNIMSIDWHDALTNQKKVIDINSKSAFYPLYAACKIYEEQAKIGNPNWRKIIFHQIYAITRTSLTKGVADLILGFNDDDKNIIIYDIANNIISAENSVKNKYLNIKEEIMKKFENIKLKFDFCISNPPYQLQISSDAESFNKQSANNIYDKFFSFGQVIADKTCMIFPAKWMTGGKGLTEFRKFILNSKNVSSIIDCKNYWELFPTISLHCGLSIVTIDNLNLYEECKIGYLSNYSVKNVVFRKLNEYDVLVIEQDKYEILKTIEKKLNIKSYDEWLLYNTMDKIVSPQKPYGFTTNFYKDKNFETSLELSKKFDVKIHYIAINNENKNVNSQANRTFCFIRNEDIKIGRDMIRGYKVCIPIAGGGDRDERNILSKTIICSENEICSESFRVCSIFDKLDDAIKFSYFMESKILRFLVSIRKLTQHAPRDVYKFVPYVDVVNKLTNWQLEVTEIARRDKLDVEIMDYFGLDKNQQKLVIGSINHIKNDLNWENFNIEDNEQ